MKHHLDYLLRAAALTGCIALCACDTSALSDGDAGAGGDLAEAPPVDMATFFPTYPFDFTYVNPFFIDAGPCGDRDYNCRGNAHGPSDVLPFSLSTDPKPELAVANAGVIRDANGDIALAPPEFTNPYLWVTNSDDWNQGTVSRIDSEKFRETARYLTVTCYSNAGGSKLACDGKSGCCAADDNARFNWRINPNGPAPARQAVDRSNTMPSGVAIDPRGDAFIANRAFNGQSSVTKIAVDLADCRDYNNDKKLETSSDVNGDGLIQTDCNDNGP